MNYPCLKCVLEYLESNQRFRLASKCPSIQKFERSIPLHLERLEITSTTIIINNYCFKTKRQASKQEEGVMPGDIVLINQRKSEDYSYHYRVMCSINGDEEDFQILKIFPEGVKFHHAMRWLGSFLFGSRHEITTRELEIVHVEVLRLPVNFKIKVTETLETNMGFLDAISQFIHPKVDTIIFYRFRHPICEHALIQTARKIYIKNGDISKEDLKIVHKNVELQRTLPDRLFEILIRNWITDGREIGTLFTFNSKGSKLSSLYTFEKMFNGRTIYENLENLWVEVSEDLVALQKELKKSHGVREGRDILYCTCLPMNSTSELQISLSRNQREYSDKIILEVVPSGSSPTLKCDRVIEYTSEKENSLVKPAAMNYPCLRCVMEYLDANQRFRLSSKCPSIRKFERSIPLHLDILEITTTTIRINGYRYKTERQYGKRETGVLEGDIVLEKPRSSEDCNYYYRAVSFPIHDVTGYADNFQTLKIFPRGGQFHAMRWMGNFLFGGRTEITTKKLEIDQVQVLRLPVNFKIKVTKILETRLDYLARISKFVNPKIETIFLVPHNRKPTRDHALLRNAEKINVRFDFQKPDLLNITHKNIEYERSLSKEDFERLVRKWIAEGKEIGSLFTLNTNHESAELSSLQHLAKMFAGRTIYRNVENSSNDTSQDLDFREKVLMKSHGLNEARTILYCTCLPMNSTSEIQISLSRGHQGGFRIRTVLEVVPFGFLPTLTTPKSDYEENKSENNSLIKPAAMNYPCLRCIVEYLEANQRFRLSSKCPSIQKIERSIPLHLDLLNITSTTIRVNDTRYTTKRKVIKHKERLQPGDIVFEHQRDAKDFSYNYQVLCSPHDIHDDEMNQDIRVDGNEDRNVQILRNFPEGVHFQDAMKWLGCQLFEKRREITTRKLVINQMTVLRLPAKFKIKVGNLETKMEYLNRITNFKFINPMTETISLSSYDESQFQNYPLIKSAKKLRLMHTLGRPSFESLIREWKADGKNIGSIFTFNSNNRPLFTLEFFEEMLKMFDGRTVYNKLKDIWDGTPEDLVALQEELKKSHGLKEGKDVLFCACLPINTTSIAQISLSKGHQGEYRNKIVIEVVPFEVWSTTLKSDNVENKTKNSVKPTLMDYPCLKCIVEYLEANQRFRLSSKCPSIRKIEQGIPLHLQLLTFDSTAIQINKCHYKLKKKTMKHEQKVLPEEIVFDNLRIRENHRYQYQVLCANRYISDNLDEENYTRWNIGIMKNFPEGVYLDSAMRWLMCQMFEGRREITTRELVVYSLNVLWLPVDFKIKRIGILNAKKEYLDEISKFILPKVDTFFYSYFGHPVTNHRLIQSVRKVEVWVALPDAVLDITHKNIERQPPLPIGMVEELIRKWIADGRESGSTFSSYSSNSVLQSQLNLMQYLEKTFDGRTIYKRMENLSNGTSKNLIALQEELRKIHGLNGKRNILYCICLPMNSTSELQVSLSKGHLIEMVHSSKIVVKVVSSSLPTP